METGDAAEVIEKEEERKEEDDEFPAPPSLGDLEELAREEQVVPATPRTLRRADSLRQKMAARRIQRTWKHFYQELEEKKADTGIRAEAQLVEEEQEREDAISNIQVNIQSKRANKLDLKFAGSDPRSPRQSSQLGRSSSSGRNFYSQV